jgi:hypothetical protein
MASRNESGITPGTSFAGTLPEKGLDASVPEIAWPDVFEPGVVWVCAIDAAALQNKTPASRKARLRR